MEYAQLEAFMAVLLGACALIAALSGACAALVKLWRFVHRDTDRNSQDIDEFRRWLSSDKRRIDALEERQAESERMNRLQLKALFTLLGHEIDGNHTEQLAGVRDEINTYLIEK